MLCWICPDCGRDCSPAVRECPSCAQGQAGVTNGVLSMVEQLRAVPAVPLLAAAPEQYLLFGLTNGHSSVATETAVMAEEDPSIPAGETIDSLVRPLVESAKPAPVDAAPVEAAPIVAPQVEVAPAPPIALLNIPTAEPPTESPAPRDS